MTWNIEGFHRNIHSLKFFIEEYNPDLIFLSEPQMYLCNADLDFQYLKGDFSYELNSPDQFDPELPLVKSRAEGGTMVIWRNSLDPHITRLPTPSPSMLPFSFHPPYCQQSFHVCVYLPTSGHEARFLDELSKLSTLLYDLSQKNPNAPIFIRGDLNASIKNVKRRALLNSILDVEIRNFTRIRQKILR